MEVELYSQHYSAITTRVYSKVVGKNIFTTIKNGTANITIENPIQSFESDEDIEENSPNHYLIYHVDQINNILKYLGVNESNLINSNLFITHALDRMLDQYVQTNNRESKE